MLPNEPNNPSKDFSLDPVSTSPDLDHTLLSEHAAQSLVGATVIQAVKSVAKPEATSQSVSVPGYEIDGILGRGGMGLSTKLVIES